MDTANKTIQGKEMEESWRSDLIPIYNKTMKGYVKITEVIERIFLRNSRKKMWENCRKINTIDLSTFLKQINNNNDGKLMKLSS